MHPADITAALKKKNSSGAEVGRTLGISRQATTGVIHGLDRSQRVEREIARVTGLSLPVLWPQHYGRKAT